MVRWRCCLFLAMLLVLPVRTSPKLDDDDEEARDDVDEEEEDDEEDDEEPAEKSDHPGRRAPIALPTQAPTVTVTRTPGKRPLECYVCAYKTETQLKSCLDPTKYRVHTMTCHSVDDKCFTSVISKGNAYEAVLRGCRSGCVGSTETSCCELNRCNNQALDLPKPEGAPRVFTAASKANSQIPPSVLFFVTILLVLQTVVKVAIV